MEILYQPAFYRNRLCNHTTISFADLVQPIAHEWTNGARGSEFVPFIGLASVTAIAIIERRSITLFRLTLRRGLELEFHLCLPNGYFHRLIEPELVKPSGLQRFITHTFGIALLYFGIYVLWAILALYSDYEIKRRAEWPHNPPDQEALRTS